MISSQSAISRFRRDLTLGAVVKGLLLTLAVVAVLFGPRLGAAFDRTVVLALIGGVWLVLSVTSAKGSRLAAGSPPLIATGQFDEAERVIDRALRSFSLFRGAKFLSLHQLAVLRHAQRRYHDAAALSRALLGQRLGGMNGLSKSSRFILADALLEMGDVRGADEAIRGLYQHRLSLGEVLNLLSVQLDYQSRVGAWQDMMAQAATKAQLAELMPAANSARAQALLGLAAQKVGRPDWAEWLRRRAELLADMQRLTKERPALWELWGNAGRDAQGAAAPGAG
jgi:hypothetical protein